MRAAEAYVAEASAWAKFLVVLAGPVKRDPYKAVADRLGPDVPRSKIYSLARRPSSLKEIGAHIHAALRAAYAAECERQRKLLEHETTIAAAAGVNPAALRAAARMGGLDSSHPQTP